MRDTAVSVLTPAGTGAIATVEVCGPRAWELARELFRPAGKPLPEAPEANRFWFGTLGADEVVLAVASGGHKPPGETRVEVHCHGGRRVVRWVVEQFLSLGCVEERTPRPADEGFELLQRAPTLRTANIILDQLNGAFANEVRRILGLLEADPDEARAPLNRLAELGNTVGRHLIEPWKVAIAGPPNVGKSSLINALAGYQRAVVSEIAGTTRDAVSVRVAFDGWPFELIDTAGLREAEGLEAEGIEHAKRVLDEADLVVWLMDCSDPNPIWPPETIPPERLTGCVTKSDLPGRWDADDQGDVWSLGLPLVSSATGDVSGLVRALLSRLMPAPPAPGAAVPYTPHLIELVRAASATPREGGGFLRAALAIAEAHTAGPSALPSNP